MVMDVGLAAVLVLHVLVRDMYMLNLRVVVIVGVG
jgi:hypothetical protein